MLIVLIGNYKPDNQESMFRFPQMLESGFIAAGLKVEIWTPTVFFSKPFKSTLSGLGKWFGYLDKWVLFPLIIKMRLGKSKYKKGVRYHVCDHSNSPYLQFLPKHSTAITCHDVIAMRQALGFENLHCPVSPTGKILQKWILKNLSSAKLVAAVSQTTLDQLKEIAIKSLNAAKDWRVIYNGFNADFYVMDQYEKEKLISNAGVNPSIPYLLHVGSGLPRKNRGLLVDMLVLLKDTWKGNIVFAGEGTEPLLAEKIKSSAMEDRIVFVNKPDHQTLVALYNACDAFVFPSFSEGFGWPVIEAQAAGAPVIASNVQPMQEISGGAALHANPEVPEEFIQAFLKFNTPNFRSELIQKGFTNAKRFEPSIMIEQYLELHSLVKQIEHVS